LKRAAHHVQPAVLQEFSNSKKSCQRVPATKNVFHHKTGCFSLKTYNAACFHEKYPVFLFQETPDLLPVIIPGIGKVGVNIAPTENEDVQAL